MRVFWLEFFQPQINNNFLKLRSDVLTLPGRLPGFPLVGEHLLLHVLDCPGRPGLVVQRALLEVSSAQPESYPGHEGALRRVQEEDGEQAGPHAGPDCDLVY